MRKLFNFFDLGQSSANSNVSQSASGSANVSGSTVSSANNNGTASGASQANSSGTGTKLKRGRKMKLVQKEVESPANIGNSGTGPSEPKKRKRGKKAARQEQVTMIAASTSDDDEECSATNCARPTGECFSLLGLRFFFLNCIFCIFRS